MTSMDEFWDLLQEKTIDIDLVPHPEENNLIDILLNKKQNGWYKLYTEQGVRRGTELIYLYFEGRNGVGQEADHIYSIQLHLGDCCTNPVQRNIICRGAETWQCLVFLNSRPGENLITNELPDYIVTDAMQTLPIVGGETTDNNLLLYGIIVVGLLGAGWALRKEKRIHFTKRGLEAT